MSESTQDPFPQQIEQALEAFEKHIAHALESLTAATESIENSDQEVS